MCEEYVDEWPTDEYPDARLTRDYPEQYKEAFDRWITQNAAAGEPARAATSSSSTAPYTGYGSPPHAQPGSLPGFALGNERHAEYLRRHQADIYYLASPRQTQRAEPQGVAIGAPRDTRRGGYNYAASSGYTKAVPTFSGPSRSTPRPSTPRNVSVEANPTPTKSSRSKKLNIKLDPGFVWNRESLALLCRWKDVLKKGTYVAVESGEFPGHTKSSLDHAWSTRRQEARKSYADMMKQLE